MESQKIIDVHITHAITIRHEERLVADIFPNPRDTSTGHRSEARIDNCHLPRLDAIMMNDEILPAGRKVERHIARTQEVIGEPLLDHMLLVARAHDKLIEAIVRKHFHDMPEDGHSADLNHWFRPLHALLCNARSRTTRQQYDFHTRIIPKFGIISPAKQQHEQMTHLRQ